MSGWMRTAGHGAASGGNTSARCSVRPDFSAYGTPMIACARSASRSASSTSIGSVVSVESGKSSYSTIWGATQRAGGTGG
jgi:hypothetical protein